MRRPLTPDHLGTVLIAACALGLVLALGGAAFLESRERRADEKLQLDTPGAGRVAILLDASDPPTADQAAELEDRLREMADSEIQPGDMVSLWVLGRSAEGPLHRILRLHYPRRHANPFYQNPRRVLARYDSLFVQPVHEAVAHLPGVRAARWSPVLEAICALAELPDLQGAGRRRLVVVSDLEQHTPACSFCDHTPTFEAFRASRTFPRLRVDLRGVAVEIFFIPRARQNLDAELARQHFWRSYFFAAGAQSVEVERL